MSDAPVDAAADESVAALPGDALREGVISRVRADLGTGLVDSHLLPNTDLWLRVTADSWAAVAASLKAQGFDYFCFLSALDWMISPYGKGEDDPSELAGEATDAAAVLDEISQDPVEVDPGPADSGPADSGPAPADGLLTGVAGGTSRFQVFARVTDTRRHLGVTIKADVPDDTLTVPTWIASFAGANWHERETHEMFGINFAGHPDLRNLYLPTEFEGYPLRKNFPLLSRMIKPWPGIVDVEPMPGVADDEGSES